MRSIRRHLIIVLGLSLALVLLVGGAVLYLSVRATLTAQFDAALSSKVRSLASLTTWTREGIDFDFSDGYMPEFQPGPGAEYFEIRLADGTLIGQSRSLQDRQSMQSPSNARVASVWNAMLPDGRPGRMAALRFQPQLDPEGQLEAAAGEAMPPSPNAIVLLARSRDEIDRPLNALMAGLIGAGLAMSGELAFILWRAVGSGLRPLNRLAATVDVIDDASLSSRVDCNVPLELKPICNKLNACLARLEEAFARERRFSAAAAHELRTPVAELRTLAEVSLRWPDDPSVYAHTMKQALDIALQMESMIQTLLSLARAKESDVPIRAESILLNSIVEPILGSLQSRMSQKSIRFRNELPDRAAVRTDRAIVSSILTNLLENAVEYTPPSGEVRVSAASHNSTITLAITNTNTGLTNDDLQQVCEPFWRKDAARTDNRHFGLGMTLVHQLAGVADLEFRLGLSQAGDVEATLAIPSG